MATDVLAISCVGKFLRQNNFAGFACNLEILTTRKTLYSVFINDNLSRWLFLKISH